MTPKFDEKISLFKNAKGIDPLPITLLQWINACTKPHGVKELNHKKTVEEIREINNSEHYGNKIKKELTTELKKTLPAITAGAFMSTREKGIIDSEKIKHITGWMQFDIDLKDNPHISDASQLRDEVKKIVYVAFCGLSCSGKGVYGFIKVKYSECYREHFEQLKIDFASRRINLDPSKGGNPTDLRFYSYDPQAYIANDFRIYERFLKQQPKQILTQKKSRSLASNSFELATKILNKQGKYFHDGNRHEYIRNLCRLLNKMNIRMNEAEQYISDNLMLLSEIKSNCITYTYKRYTEEMGTWEQNEYSAKC